MVKAQAPAKINLTLDILGKRADGYHNVSTIMQAVSLYDKITVEKTDGNEITVSCNKPEIPCDRTNIVYKAAAKFFDYNKIDERAVHIDINKIIPSQAGLAGGSTDGAATILALNRLYNTLLKPKEMVEIAAHIGADVPFCLDGGTQLATGIGTKLEKIRSMPKCHVVICKPQINVSTAEAYAKVDSLPPKNAAITDIAVRSIYNGDISTICSTLYNDFEIALKLDAVNDIKKIMYKAKAKGCSMSGSGSAVFALFISERAAEKCAEKLREKYFEVYTCETINDGCKII